MNNFNLLDHPICLTFPRRRSYSSFHGHIPFTMLLVEICRPEIIVELGTYHGDSYCAFCQAVEQLKLPTHCYAIDNWHGDIHTGPYGREVLDNLRAHHDAFYGSFSKLVQSSFDIAVNQFEDASIDILHIDGCHTYEAVKHDFETWFPKLKNNGIVLIHDICELRPDFGVYPFWEELKAQYPYFEFLHASGLGVLSIGRQYPPALSFFFDSDEKSAGAIRRFFSHLGDRIEEYTIEKEETAGYYNEKHELAELQKSKLYALNSLLGISFSIIKKEGLIKFAWKFLRWLVWYWNRNRYIYLHRDDSINGRFARWNKNNRSVLSDDERDYRFMTEEISVAVKQHNDVPPEPEPQSTSPIPDNDKVKAIAFYLPQFYPIPENDIWWGKGFTEWTNVKKAKPNFAGHYQPHIPGDLGYYDLQDQNVMEKQAALAKKYGIYGFCYYYYWFDGKRLMEMPLERMLATGRPDFPFCLCWANENWTKKWDGGNNEILVEERYSSANDEAVIYDLIRYMRHPNYIRINGRPLLLVYRIDQFPNIQRTTSLWKIICMREGMEEPYLAMIESGEYTVQLFDPELLGFKARVEFSAHENFVPVKTPQPLLNAEFKGVVGDYRELILSCVNKKHNGYVRFRNATTAWDNTPRLQNNPNIFINSSPGAYQAWLEFIVRQTREIYKGDERIVFINAWNEWSEAAYLEPDEKYGYKYLEATYKALNC